MNYNDIGHYVPYAKKHLATPQCSNGSEVTLKSLWPEPDWVQWCDNGVNRDAAALMHQYYHSLRKRPRASVHIEVTDSMWLAAYLKIIPWLRDSFLGVRTLDDLTLVRSSFKGYMQIPESEGTPKLADVYSMYAAGRGERGKFKTPFALTSRSKYMAELLPKLGWPYLISHSKVKLFPVEMEHTKTGETDWALCSISGRRYQWEKENDGFKSEAEAIEALKKILDLNVPIRIPKKRLDNLRSVPGTLSGVDPQKLLDEFGFRALQYGNSLSGVERARFVDNTYYSLIHLSEVLEIPRSWIGLGGVGLAFGARGNGGAVAHYEPDLNIINLTRFNGAGSLAHEWFHAFDARIATACGAKGSLISELGDSKVFPSGKAVPMLKSFRKLQRSITKRSTDYYSNAKHIGSQRGMRNYWFRKSELLARAFEAYIQDELENLPNKHTDWLAFGTREIDCTLAEKELNPYPCRVERSEFNDIFKIQMANIWHPS